MIAWKIFSVKDGELYSYSPMHNFSVHYQRDRINYPILPNSSLFVFESKKDALAYWDGPSNEVILKVRIKKSKIQPERIADFVPDLERYWRNVSENKEYNLNGVIAMLRPPEGTVFADWVEILEK